MSKNIVIFASGSGTNTETIIRYFKGNDSIKVSLVLSNKSDAYVLKRAEAFGVPSEVFSADDWKTGDKILTLLQEYQIDLVVLAGFMIRVPDLLLHAYPNKIINIHPSLLPKYGGKGMYGDRVHEAVLAAGEEETGITIHYVNEHYDEGGIIFQGTCRILRWYSPADVAKKVHYLEYQYYPMVIHKLLLDSM